MNQMTVCFILSLLILGNFLRSASAECTNNFTGLQNPASQDNIVTLPQNERNPFFTFNQWIFPNLRFDCSRNLSVVTVRVDTTLGQLPPGLFIWQRVLSGDFSLVSYERINLTVPSGRIVETGNGQTSRYEFEPPLEVTQRQFIGFKFDFNTNDQLSHPIEFVDVGEGNAPVSVYASAGQSETFIQLQAGNPFVDQSTRYILLISAEFVSAEPEETATHPLSTLPTPLTPSTSLPVTTLSAPTQPSAPVVVDTGLIAGVVVPGVLLVLMIVIICCFACCRNKTARVYKNSDEHIDSNPAYISNTVDLEGTSIAYSPASANENCLGILDHDYEVITSDNVAYQASNRRSRDNLHLVSNEVSASSVNPRSDNQDYTYVDESSMTERNMPGQENEVNTSNNITDQAVTRQSDDLHLKLNEAYASNANLALDREELETEYAYVNELEGSPDLENELTTSACEGVNRQSSDETDDICLHSNKAYIPTPKSILHNEP